MCENNVLSNSGADVYGSTMTNNRSDSNASGLAYDVMQHDLQRREALILGDGPRIQPLSVEELTSDLVQMIERMMQLNSVIESRDQEMLTDVTSHQEADASSESLTAKLGNLPEIMRTLLRHPNLFLRHTDTGIQLLTQGALASRDRELAILRIAWLCRAPYEWGEHVHIAKKVGLTSADIERITQGSDVAGWSEHEQAILRATEELHKDAMISDATWVTLSKRLDDRQLIELPVLVGQYQGVAYYQNSLRLRLHDGNLGLEAR
jgi:alkylhydroperoxidase family enzyme